MRKLVLAVIIAVLSGSAVLADPVNRRPKMDDGLPLDRLPRPKSAVRNSCAGFGPGFVKVEGTHTCVKVGGAFSVDLSGARGGR